MVELVVGGSGSGKSVYAEKKIIELHRENPKGRLIYLATMMAHGEEGKERVLRHKNLRKGKGFVTLEEPCSLKKIQLSGQEDVLLEDLGNLVANIFFLKKEILEEKALEEVVDEIYKEILNFSAGCNHLVLVGNQVGCDGIEYSKETKEYIYILQTLQNKLSYNFKNLTEVVVGIPIFHDGKEGKEKE